MSCRERNLAIERRSRMKIKQGDWTEMVECDYKPNHAITYKLHSLEEEIFIKDIGGKGRVCRVNVVVLR